MSRQTDFRKRLSSDSDWALSVEQTVKVVELVINRIVAKALGLSLPLRSSAAGFYEAYADGKAVRGAKPLSSIFNDALTASGQPGPVCDMP